MPPEETVSLKEMLTHIYEDMKEGRNAHAKDDDERFKALREADEKHSESMAILTECITKLTTQMSAILENVEAEKRVAKAEKKTYLTWPWYIGTMIVLGGVVMASMNSLRDDTNVQLTKVQTMVEAIKSTVDSIDFVATK